MSEWIRQLVPHTGCINSYFQLFFIYPSSSWNSWKICAHDHEAVGAVRHALNYRDPPDILLRGCMCERPGEKDWWSRCENSAGDSPQDSLRASVCVDYVLNLDGCKMKKAKRKHISPCMKTWCYECRRLERALREMSQCRCQCAANKDVISAVEKIREILCSPSAPPLTRTPQRFTYYKHVWAENLPLCCVCVSHFSGQSESHFWKQHLWSENYHQYLFSQKISTWQFSQSECRLWFHEGLCNFSHLASRHTKQTNWIRCHHYVRPTQLSDVKCFFSSRQLSIQCRESIYSHWGLH